MTTLKSKFITETVNFVNSINLYPIDIESNKTNFREMLSLVRSEKKMCKVLAVKCAKRGEYVKAGMYLQQEKVYKVLFSMASLSCVSK